MFTSRPGILSNDFFVNLLDMSTKWEKSAGTQGVYEGRDRATGDLKWTATPTTVERCSCGTSPTPGPS